MNIKEQTLLLNDDFTRVTGRPFKHFFCPILHRDEDAKLCAGHVIPKSLGGEQRIPQRADVDNFFGTIAEADFSIAISDRNAEMTDILFDSRLRKRHRPTLEHAGQSLEFYFPADFKELDGHTPVYCFNEDGTKQKAFVVKLSTDELRELCGKDIKLSVNRDYTAAVAASVLKAAHLTLFNIMGYQYVFSVPGYYLAEILRTFFIKHRQTPRKEIAGAMNASFGDLSNMIAPVTLVDESVFSGTLQDKRMLACCGATTGIFSVGVIVKAASDAFCVFLPTDQGSAIDTYFSFVRQPPDSIAARLLHFCTDTKESRWETNNGEPFRMQLNGSM